MMPYKPKILIFIDWYKPGYKAGGPIRSISNFVDYLSDHLELLIVTRNTDYLDDQPYTSIQSNDWNTVDNIPVFYISKDNLNFKTIKRLMVETKPDYIYLNSLYSFYFTILPLFLAKRLQVKPILATRGMLSQGALNIKSTKKKLFLLLAKASCIFKNIEFHATSVDEKKDIIFQLKAKENVTIIQNFPNKSPLPFHVKLKKKGHLNLVYVGRIAPEKNIYFSLKVLKKTTQQISFDLYGPIYDEEYWRKCLAFINELPKNVTVNYKGVLPHEHLNKTLINYHGLLLPSTGENFGHIIIEAMNCSCIPIISNKTPWKNLESRNIGFDIDLALPHKFTTIIDELAQTDEKTLNTSTKNAHTFAQKIINDKETSSAYIQLFRP